MDPESNTLVELLPFLIPVILIQCGLFVFALIDLIKPERKVKGGNKVVWIIVVAFVNIFGPLLYFFWGREES